MTAQSTLLRLQDIAEAIVRVREIISPLSIETFESDWQKVWLVTRGLEIISEASRHLPDELKARHTEIPWTKIAGIGNVLRHDYERVAPAILWKAARDDLPILDSVVTAELARNAGD